MWTHEEIRDFSGESSRQVFPILTLKYMELKIDEVEGHRALLKSYLLRQ